MIYKDKLIGKNVLITAGAQGIGEAITKQFIDAGANVAIHYFSSSKMANQLKEYAISKEQKAVAIGGDLTKEADAKALVKETLEVLGGLDILINNAGSLVARKRLNEIETDFWHKVMDIAGRKGGHAGSLAYSTSKGAILTYPRTCFRIRCARYKG